MSSGVTLDFSKAQPISNAVTLDFSKAQPIAQPEEKAPPGTLRGRAQHLEKVAPGIPGPGTPERAASGQQGQDIAKVAVPMAAGIIAPEFLPEIGSAVLGGAATGAVSGAATAGAQKLMGEPVSAGDIAASTVGGAAFGGALGLAGGWMQKLFGSKMARGAVNFSAGATTRDITYGNPAKALLNEGISAADTGSIEKYKEALRSGLPHDQALVQAGGRLGQVASKINELEPQLQQVLSSSPASISVSQTIDKPLMDAFSEIANNKGMGIDEKMAAIHQLGALQQSTKEGITGNSISPIEALKIKRDVGNRVNWGGNIAITDEVKPAYKAVYGSLANAIHKAAPESASLDERLSNLLSAETDLEKLAKAEEAGQGRGFPMSVGAVTKSAKDLAGRAIPGVSAASGQVPQAATRVAVPAGATIGDQLKSKGVQIPQQQQQSPELPFHPGQGISR